MQVVPGTHLLDQILHRDTFNEHNLLTRGQEIAVDVDESQAVSIELEPGEMSLHHVCIVHGSPPNHSDKCRISYAIRCIPTRPTCGNSKARTARRSCAVPEDCAIPVQKAIPFDRACLIGCGVMTGFSAATNIAPDKLALA